MTKCSAPKLSQLVIAVLLPIGLGVTRSAPSQIQPTPVDAVTKLPEFSVVSIKPDKSGGGFRTMFTPDGFSATNISLRMLLRQVFGVGDDHISGLPDWANSDRFDIEAKVDEADSAAFGMFTPDQRKLMLQPLLADRFLLKFHFETRDLPLYTLVIAKSGLRMKEATPGDTYPKGLKLPQGQSSGAGMWRASDNQMIGQAIPVANLITFLSRQLGRTVLDRTGLTGKYDFDLKWTPDRAAGSAVPSADGQQSPLPSPDAPGPSVFTALQEQLGLKLEGAKGPEQVLVVDHVERPSEN